MNNEDKKKYLDAPRVYVRNRITCLGHSDNCEKTFIRRDRVLKGRSRATHGLCSKCKGVNRYLSDSEGRYGLHFPAKTKGE